jgi:heavy metal sensor kinase
VFIFGTITYLRLKTVLIKNIDLALYNGGKILEESLTEYKLKDENDLRSLYDPSEEDDEFLVDEIDEEIHEIFFVRVAYVQLRAFSEDMGISPQSFIKTATLEDLSLPIAEYTYKNLKTTPYFHETVTGVFAYPLRMMNMQIHDQDGRPYILQLALSLQDVRTTLRNLLLIFAVLFPALVVVISILGYVFMKRVFLPVKKMVGVTKSITAEDLSLRLESLDSRDEIGELAETLNEMISRLDHSFNQIKRFSGDVSHELKTPLAKLRINAEIALRRERTEKEYRQVIKNMIEDAENLQKIIEDLLLLARMDSRSISISFATLALHEVFFEVFEDTHLLAKHNNLALGFEEIEHVDIKGDHGLIKRLFTNLIINAVQYTPTGGEVVFSLHKENGYAEFAITDTGVGIPEDALPYIFDRFYRVDKSRSQETGGFGLGLSIAQKIAEVHRGHIIVQSSVGKGTTFQVSLPCLL